MLDLNNPAHPGHSNYLISSKGRQAEQLFYSHNPLPESTRSELLDECFRHSEERCGFITSEFEVIGVLNSHLEPRMNFYMHPKDTEWVLDEIYGKKQTEILGIYHTHPNGYPWPSPRDLVGWPNPALGWRYFLVSRGDVTEWRLLGD
jgi:proteasome lid subunit RPN8/RPN11